MPTLNLVTNVKIDDPKEFSLEFSRLGAEILQKPELWISVSITYNETLTFGASHDPAFQLSINSLDNINREVNEGYSKAFFEFFEKKLGIKSNRGYILFVDPGRANIGHQGTTFATIFNKL